jgi:uncharacterized protein (DUF4415 family)
LNIANHWADAVVGVPPLKATVDARFDADVVEWLKSGERSYQTAMNPVLRLSMQTNRTAG